MPPLSHAQALHLSLLLEILAPRTLGQGCASELWAGESGDIYRAVGLLEICFFTSGQRDIRPRRAPEIRI